MTDRFVGKILACMLAIVFPAAMISAETHAAMLYATNTVMLNGVGAERSSAVFAGDNIQTPANTTVRLTSEGNTVLVGPLSNVVYQGDGMRLSSGSAMVTTENGMKTQVQRFLITPAAQTRSTYRVVRGGGTVMVAALRGSVNVAEGSSTKTVAEGNTASMPDPEPAPQSPGATPGASTGSAGVSNTTLALILAGVAAGTALLVYETTKSPMTPN